ACGSGAVLRSAAYSPLPRAKSAEWSCAPADPARRLAPALAGGVGIGRVLLLRGAFGRVVRGPFDGCGLVRRVVTRGGALRVGGLRVGIGSLSRGVAGGRPVGGVRPALLRRLPGGLPAAVIPLSVRLLCVRLLCVLRPGVLRLGVLRLGGLPVGVLLPTAFL